MLHDILRGQDVTGKKTRRSKRIQMVDDSTGNISNYTDPKKEAEDRSVWRTLRRDCHKPAESADHSKKEKNLYSSTTNTVTVILQYYYCFHLQT